MKNNNYNFTFWHSWTYIVPVIGIWHWWDCKSTFIFWPYFFNIIIFKCYSFIIISFKNIENSKAINQTKMYLLPSMSTLSNLELCTTSHYIFFKHWTLRIPLHLSVNELERELEFDQLYTSFKYLLHKFCVLSIQAKFTA